MVAAVDAHGWDGEWFRRAYDFFGEPIGSAANDEGQIFIEPQGICIMAGIGLDDGRAVQALAAVRERLATPHGIVLQQPAFSTYQLRLGEISSYPPGYKENAGIFCHTNPWLMIAEALAGNADGALDYYLRINPSAREAISDIHRCEPYVYAQMIAGRDAADPRRGEELVADRHGRLELRRGDPVDRRHPAGARRAADRPARSGRLGRHPRDAPVPRRHLPDRGPSPGDDDRGRTDMCDAARRRRTAGRRQPRAAAVGSRRRDRGRRLPRGTHRGATVTSDDGGRATDDTTGGDFYGRATRRIANDALWVEVLATAGPRIIRLGLTGSPRNLLAETPDVGWETPYGRYELFGGHRLWFAPEDPDRVAVPDGNGLVLDQQRDGIRLTGPAERPTGLVRSMTLRLTCGRAGLEICHELRNVSDTSVELAPWAITQLPLGGTVLLPQPAATPGHHVHPNRTLVLWPYSSWEDPRFRPLDGLLTLDAEAGPSLKLGYFNEAGWVGYVRDGTVLVRRFVPLPGRPHPDLGCNTEVYIGGQFLELELLGPLTRLEPGATVAFSGSWDIEAPVRSSIDRVCGRSPTG